MNFFLSNQTSIQKNFELFDVYNRASGATLNFKKTKILKLGNTELNCFSTNEVKKLKIYGVFFDRNGFDRTKSIEQAESSIRKLSGLYPHSEFSLDSRSIFINTYFLSKFWYCACFIRPPDDLIQLANKAITRFLWYPSRMPKMKGAVIKNSKKFGGIGAPDIERKITAFRVMFLAKISTYSSLKCFHYVIERYQSIKNVKDPRRLIRYADFFVICYT